MNIRRFDCHPLGITPCGLETCSLFEYPLLFRDLLSLRLKLNSEVVISLATGGVHVVLVFVPFWSLFFTIVMWGVPSINKQFVIYSLNKQFFKLVCISDFYTMSLKIEVKSAVGLLVSCIYYGIYYFLHFYYRKLLLDARLGGVFKISAGNCFTLTRP